MSTLRTHLRRFVVLKNPPIFTIGWLTQYVRVQGDDNTQHWVLPREIYNSRSRICPSDLGATHFNIPFQLWSPAPGDELCSQVPIDCVADSRLREPLPHRADRLCNGLQPAMSSASFSVKSTFSEDNFGTTGAEYK